MAEDNYTLRFGLGKIQQALRLAKDLAKRTRDAASSAREAGEGAAGVADEDDPRLRRQAAFRAREARERGQRRADRARRRFGNGFGGAGGFNPGELDESLLQFGEGQGGFRAAGLATKGLGQIAGTLVGGAFGGALVNLAEVIVEDFVRPVLRERFAALEREKLDPILARLDQLEREAFPERLENDPALQRLIAEGEIGRNAVLSAGQVVRTPGPLGRL